MPTGFLQTPRAPQPTSSSGWRRHYAQGATGSLLLGLLAAAITVGYASFSPYGMGTLLAGTLALLAALLLGGGLLVLLGRLVGQLPTRYRWMLTSLLILFAVVALDAMTAIGGVLAVFVGFVLGLSLLGGGLVSLARYGWTAMTFRQRLVTGGGLALGVLLLSAVGWLLLSPGAPADRSAVRGAALGDVPPLVVPDPALPGPYPVRTLTYGSGTDRRRTEYGASVDLVTPTYDASPLLEGWSSLRRRYWGFGPESVPLNARVWYSVGEGPFPLVVMVHGNADMTRGSDRGYAYLGELLASRGYVFVSVDENFLNRSTVADVFSIAPLQSANDVRAVLLLEHLKLWRAWNETPGNPFYGQVDMGRIALGGHSRGGEAAAIAAVFNRLPYHPDDASVRFDYGFAIQAVFALAPTEGQYRPAGRPLVVQDVDYLVLHGAQDMDVITFMGSAQFERVRLTRDGRFKAALYVDGANHGQFNTVWGLEDLPSPALLLYNRAQLLAGEEQRRIAAVYVSAFLEASLQGHREYLPLFQDVRTGLQWLPRTRYLSRYDDSTTIPVSTFDEDFDLSTTTMPGGRLQGVGLTEWREGALAGKLGQTLAHALFLGWDHGQSEDARYTVWLPPAGPALQPEDMLVLDFAVARSGDEDGRVDYTLEVVDRVGRMARLALSEVAPAGPAITAEIAKARSMNVLLPSSEPVFQTVAVPLTWFTRRNPQLDLENLAAVSLVFDRTPSGRIVVERLGFRKR